MKIFSAVLLVSVSSMALGQETTDQEQAAEASAAAQGRVEGAAAIRNATDAIHANTGAIADLSATATADAQISESGLDTGAAPSLNAGAAVNEAQTIRDIVKAARPGDGG
jgi:hypothetical protein